VVEIKGERVREILEQVRNKRVLILGDFYLDEYFHCSTNEFSPEAPVPRVVVNKIEHVPGCAGNVANGFASVGANVTCAGVIGNDEKGNIMRNLLLQKGINTAGLIPDMTRKTGVFSRIVVEGSGGIKQHHIRFDQENQEKISQQTHANVLESIQNMLPTIDLIFIADYDEANGTGLITIPFLNSITQLATQYNVKTAGISRLKITEFTNMDMIICNEIEAKELGDGHQFATQNNINTVVISRGKDGVKAHKDGVITELPSFATNIVDVCGAGDALSTMFALTMTSDASLEEQAITASHSAAIVCSKPGTSTASADEIIAISGKEKETKITNHTELLRKITQLKQEGKKVIFTNGYFDNLNATHIRFLQKAKELGDHLIVAINSDSSMRTNKGHQFPTLAQEDRCHIIASMECVDSVTVFDELTPLNIISHLKPHVLAKGANHRNTQIVGQTVVEAHGGKVELIEL
jgi:D-beta-D-heptose 7-phosphate kinase/D-beta-D-heptose 1-phosphate adenosyltransferase